MELNSRQLANLAEAYNNLAIVYNDVNDFNYTKFNLDKAEKFIKSAQAMFSLEELSMPKDKKEDIKNIFDIHYKLDNLALIIKLNIEEINRLQNLNKQNGE